LNRVKPLLVFIVALIKSQGWGHRDELETGLVLKMPCDKGSVGGMQEILGNRKRE
jgi:hypothetical protein